MAKAPRVGRLAVAGEAGFTIEQMIDLLNSGSAVDTLLEPIAWQLEGAQSASPSVNANLNWGVPGPSAEA